ncbi:MAG: PAS domain-containing sensor histidine kinase [Alphaproteobacteria bacterium]|nr:PAS domain-containing sensor histidine kinase [Alphaproteobacteria bacterium]
MAVQAAKGAVGTVLGLGFFGLIGRPDLAEALALAGLMAPALLALLGLTRLPLAVLEQMGLGLFAVLIGYLTALTGGLSSPLLIWFALVPAEAALAGAHDGRSNPAVMRAGLIAGAALMMVVVLEALSALPASRLLLPGAMPGWALYAVSGLGALVQAVLIAAAAQDRQRAADAAAAQGAAMYRFLADNSMDLITRHSSDGCVCFASPATHALLGRAPEEIVGLAPAELVHPDDLAAVQSALMEASYFGRLGEAQVRLRHKDGHHVWAEIRCRPGQGMERGAGGDIVAVTRDITERKAQERALVEARDAALAASRAKSRFLANMSHELRTPLNAIIGFSEVMNREMFGTIGPRYQEYSRLIHESGTHLLDLINSVLDMSKIEAGKFELAEELFELGDVVDSAVRFLTMPAERAGVGLVQHVAPQARQIFADRRAVKQILVNLLSNGVKYTPPGGEVRIAVEATPQGVVLSVSDTGTGISADDLKRLGQPFEQVEGAETRGKEGTGLGLALVKALAAMHGGEAELHSVLGEGTTVSVRLPHAAVDGAGERLNTAKILRFRAAS